MEICRHDDGIWTMKAVGLADFACGGHRGEPRRCPRASPEGSSRASARIAGTGETG